MTNFAFDTETVNGNIVVLAISNGDYIIEPDLKQCLELLTKNTNQTRYFTYNLRFDVDGILKKLPHDYLHELLGVGSTLYGDYKIRYFGKSSFSISKKHVAKSGKISYVTGCKTWDITQFYFYKTLEEMSKMHLDRDDWKKDSVVISNFKSIKNNKKYFYSHQDEIIDYCIADANATRLLADKFELMCLEHDYSFKFPYSIGNLGMKFFKNNINEIPDRIFSKSKYIVNDDLDIQKYKDYKNLEDAFSLVARGGWNDVYKRGSWKQVYDYDIVSAYPSAMYQCPYWDGEWKITNKLLSSFNQDSYGIVTGRLKNLDIPVLPYRYHYLYEDNYKTGITRWLNHSIIWSNSREWIDIELPLDMFLYIKDYCCYEIDNIVYLKPKNKSYPLRKSVDVIFNRKRAAKEKYGIDSIEYKLPKGILNSTSGKFKQLQHSNSTWFYYPHLYSKITWSTKRSVMDVLNRNKAWDNVISISTDGVTLTKPLSKIDIGSGMGQWEYMQLNNYVSIGNGIYYGYKDNGDLKWKARGYNLKVDGNKINIMDLINNIKNKNTDKIKLELIRPVHLREAFIHNKILKLKDVNRFVLVSRFLNINQEVKRRWDDKFKDIEELLSGKIINSRPQDASWSLEQGRLQKIMIKEKLKD